MDDAAKDPPKRRTARARRKAGSKRIEAERKRTPRKSYAEVRNRIRTGDLIFFRGRGPFSRLIRAISGSVYSHVGIAAWWGDHLVVFQSKLPMGVEVVLARRMVDKYDGQVDWWAVGDAHDASLDRGLLLRRAVGELGKPYSVFGLIRLGLVLLLARILGRRDSVSAQEGYFCSQYVSLCYRDAGLDLAPQIDDACTTPGDIARSGVAELRSVLRRPR